MNDFHEVVNEVLFNCKNNLQNKVVENEMILGLYYIKEYLRNGYTLSQQNIFSLSEIILILNKLDYMNCFLKDIKFSIFLFLAKTVQNLSKEEESKKDFFKVYVYFDDIENIIENKDLIKLLFPQNKLNEYLSLFDRVISEDKNFFSRTFIEKERIIWKFQTLTIYFYERNIENFKKLFEYLYKLFLKAIELNDEKMVLYIYSSLQFSWNAVSSTQEEFKYFNEKVEKRLEKYIKDKIIKKYGFKPIEKELKNKEVINVAFLQERFIHYSIYKVFYSVLNALSKKINTKFRFIIMDLNFQLFGGSSKNVVEEIKTLGFEYIDCQKETIGINSPFYDYSEKCIKLRELVISKDIDVLIGMHSQPEYNFLFTTRTAPVQIYWTHGNYVYDLKNIDYRMKHGDFAVDKIIHDGYTFLQFGDIMDKNFLNPIIPSEFISSEKLKYPPNCFVLGTIGRLSKVDSVEYINMIDDILLENPDVIYIAGGSGDENSIKSKINEKTLSRWYFPGHIDSHLYGHIIDVWTNTFPHPQGLSTVEFMAKGKAVLTMKNHSHDFEIQDMYNKKRTDKFKDFRMNVESIDEYKRSLNLLISNKEARDLMGQQNLEYIEKNYYDSTNSINRFYEILEEVIL